MKSSFVYEGKQIVLDEDERFCRDGFTVEKQSTFYDCGATYSLLTFTQSKGTSGRVERILDLDHVFALDGYRPSQNGFYGYYDKGIKVVATEGGDFGEFEFMPRPECVMERGLRFSNSGGRSSQGKSPFFDVTDGQRGFLLAIGWTGQWFCQFVAEENELRVQVGIEDVSTVLYEGESIRTASVLVLPYEDGSDKAHNVFRKLIRDEFSVVGKGKRQEIPPLCLSSWGGSGADFLISSLQEAKKEALGFEYYWMDAGWYGNYEGESPSEFADNWFPHTGDWNVNPNVYSGDAFDRVFATAAQTGLKNILWLEPERAQKTSRFYQQNPDLFLDIGQESVSLNLADPRAREYMYDTVASYVEQLNLACYRQDFNYNPLPYWQAEDKKNPDRVGMAQIGHIMGLYEVWDKLLARFPDLIIDNCASGGRRLDIETCKRSMPLWRSDVNCAFDCETAYTQAHNAALSRWLPYHGCGIGFLVEDKYRFRSCHAPSMTTNFMGYIANKDNPKDYEAIRAHIAEFKQVRYLYTQDFYPIFGYGGNKNSWGGWQFEDPKSGKGIVEGFRREECLSDSVTVFLGGVTKNMQYVFQNTDTGEEFTRSGEQLMQDGLTLTLKQKASCVMLTYQKKEA